MNDELDLKGDPWTRETLESALKKMKMDHEQYPWGRPCHHIVGRRPDVKFKDTWYYVCAYCCTLLVADEVDKVLHRTMEDWFSPDEWQSVRGAMERRGLNADILNPMPEYCNARIVHADGSPLDAFEAYQFKITNQVPDLLSAIERELFNALAYGRMSFERENFFEGVLKKTEKLFCE